MPEITQDIDALFIKWESIQGNLLIISCSRSGSISRLGDESLSFPPSPICIGKTEEPLFNELMDAFQEEWLEYAGRYEFPNLTEEKQTLTVQFTGEDLDTGFEFIFDEHSEGPPEDILQFVELALAATAPWYQDQLAAKTQKKRKK